MKENKFYQRTKQINGKNYAAQFNGLSASLKAIDESYIDDSSNISIEKLSKYIFENVIIDPPHLTADDFDDMDEFNEVVKFGREVMQGKFRNKGTDESGKKEESKE